jgi:hypothetical protein
LVEPSCQRSFRYDIRTAGSDAIPAARASADALAPGLSVAATSCSFSVVVQRRSRSTDVMTSRCGNRSPHCPFCFGNYQRGRKRGQCQHPGCACRSYSPLTDQPRPVNKCAARLHCVGGQLRAKGYTWVPEKERTAEERGLIEEAIGWALQARRGTVSVSSGWEGVAGVFDVERR